MHVNRSFARSAEAKGESFHISRHYQTRRFYVDVHRGPKRRRGESGCPPSRTNMGDPQDMLIACSENIVIMKVAFGLRVISYRENFGE